MGVAIFVLAGLLYPAYLIGAMVTGARLGPVEIERPAVQFAIAAAGVAVSALSAWAFLASVHKSKRFLSDRGVELESFAGTIGWFFVPFASYYVPWKRLASIRNSMSNYLRTGDAVVHEDGRGATILLAVLYLGHGALGLLTRSGQEIVLLVDVAAWFISFVYAVYWLWSLAAMRTQASRRFAIGQGAAEVFA